MDSPILITFFNEKTRLEFINSSKTFLSHKQKVKNAKAGTIIVLSDPSCGVFGLAVLKNAPDSDTPCIKSSMLDEQTHVGQDDKYNAYHLYLKEVKLFKTPVTHASIKATISAPDIVGHGNMWQNNQICFCRPFHKGVDEAVVSRYVSLIQMMKTV